MHRACFTGHRPEKLQQTETVIRRMLEREILKAADSGIRVFLSGMARGVDIRAAQIVLRLRSAGRDIKLICACLYPGFERAWSRDWQRQYRGRRDRTGRRRARIIRFRSFDIHCQTAHFSAALCPRSLRNVYTQSQLRHASA